MNDYVRALDDALRDVGEDVVIRRMVGTGNAAAYVDVAVRAVVRAFAPNELVGTISQTDSLVILSPTQITEAQWPGGLPVSASPYVPDPRVPRINDRAIIQGKVRTISFVKPILEDGELVRIELTVAG